MNYPERITDISTLDELLSDPTEQAISALGKVQGDIILLGVGGKMGPTLARMIKKGSDLAGVSRSIFGVSRFSNPKHAQQLQGLGIETIAGDLLDEEFIQQLPDIPNVIHMTGMKFGASGNAPLTWAMNTYVPSLVCRKFADSRIVAFSTGNVYPLVPVASGGSLESDPPNPNGEYAMSALGRERTFQYFCNTLEIPTALIRLNYANELRYGVLVDLAQQVASELPIDVSMGYVNVIWQADANAMTISALPDAKVPAEIINVSGPEILSVRSICERFGELLQKPVTFTGTEATDALLNNGSKGHQRYGMPRVSAEQLITWIADWIKNGNPLLGKPTHFESRSGKF